MAKVFGVPAANENTALFFPGIGGRNAAAGLMFLFLTWRGAINGQKMRQGYAQALGMHSAVWSLAGFSGKERNDEKRLDNVCENFCFTDPRNADVWILMQTPQTENAMIHVLNICILLLVGSTVLWTHGLN